VLDFTPRAAELTGGMTMESRTRRRGLSVLVACGALVLMLGLNVASASASVFCTFDFASGQVQIVVSDDSPPNLLNTNNTITVQRGGSNTIVVNGANCLDPVVFTFATTLNAQQINVSPASNGANGNDTLVINEASGEFTPGAPTAGLSDFFSPSLNEMEWYVNLGLGTNTLQLIETAGENAVTIGSDGGGFSPSSPAANTIWDGAPPNGASPGSATTDPPFPSCYVGDPLAGDLMINLNSFPADDDADVYAPAGRGVGECATSGISRVVVDLGAGDNFITGKGGNGTGAPTSLPLVINAGPGDDTLIGGLGEDVINPGGGNDFVDLNAPFGQVLTPRQDDVLGRWTCGARFGNIVDFSGQPGPLTIVINNDGTLTVNGVTGSFLGVQGVIGSQGNDSITGNNLDNILVGGGGNDTIDGQAGNDCLDGDNVSGFAAVPGTPGDDTLAGGLGNDVVLGGPANDTLDENKPLNANGTPAYGPLGNGADAIDGGDGVDTVTYAARLTRIVVYLGLISTFNDGADTNADGLSNEFDDVFFTTENVITGGYEDIVSANFVNNRADNVFTDNGGNDCLEGGPGNDTFVQGSAPQGADVMIGNTGTDTGDYSARTGAVQVILDGVANDGDIATNEGDNVGGFSVSCRPQTVVVNPPLSVLLDLVGSPAVVNSLTFLDAPVTGPAPQVCGFVPVDVFVPVDGIVLDGIPIIGLARAPQGAFCPGEQLGGDQAPLTQDDVENVNGGSGNDILVGGASGNVLNGNGGDDQISGEAGSDSLNGGDGNDTIRGGDGNDAVNGGSGTNTIDYASAGAGGVGVNVNLTTGVASGQGTDTLTSIQNVRGSSFGDSLSGDGTNNVLNGNGGPDALSGNAGDDTVNGGAGPDQAAGGVGNDKMAGAEGNDAMQGGQGNDTMQGGQGADTLLGQRGNDSLYGNAQPDFLNGGPGVDICKPGSPGLARGDVVVNCDR
jgi:Ca2+-binding RTX toxin-like protein